MANLVGVMDSGVGGLTVLWQLQRLCPTNDYLYVADHAYCPYGVRPLSEICRRVVQVALFLKKNGATHIVIACNTASVFAKEIAQATCLPVLDVINPTCQKVLDIHGKRVALLATDATVKSGIYSKILQSHGVDVLAFPCSPLVPLVEKAADKQTRQTVVQSCLKGLADYSADTVILGCTHFPLLKKDILPYCGNAKIVCCSTSAAQEFLQKFALQTTVSGRKKGATTYLSTGVSAVKYHCRFHHVDV